MHRMVIMKIIKCVMCLFYIRIRKTISWHYIADRSWSIFFFFLIFGWVNCSIGQQIWRSLGYQKRYFVPRWIRYGPNLSFIFIYSIILYCFKCNFCQLNVIVCVIIHKSFQYGSFPIFIGKCPMLFGKIRKWKTLANK